MSLDYNIKPSQNDILFKVLDTINISYYAYKWDDTLQDWVLYSLIGKRIDIHFRRKDGLLVKSFSSAGIAPAITILGTIYNCYSVVGFLVADVLDYDVQVTDGSDILTIQEGQAFVKKQITT